MVEVNSTLAEYHGLRQAQLFIKEHAVKTNRIIFLTDCKTMVQHLDKTPCISSLRDYALQLREGLDSFNNAELKHIPREHNKITDGLVNQLMDMYERGGEVCH
ncbi:reverse transcriptase-like protein [Priestia megaterium]